MTPKKATQNQEKSANENKVSSQLEQAPDKTVQENQDISQSSNIFSREKFSFGKIFVRVLIPVAATIIAVGTQYLDLLRQNGIPATPFTILISLCLFGYILYLFRKDDEKKFDVKKILPILPYIVALVVIAIYPLIYPPTDIPKETLEKVRVSLNQISLEFSQDTTPTEAELRQKKLCDDLLAKGDNLNESDIQTMLIQFLNYWINSSPVSLFSDDSGHLLHPKYTDVAHHYLSPAGVDALDYLMQHFFSDDDPRIFDLATQAKDASDRNMTSTEISHILITATNVADGRNNATATLQAQSTQMISDRSTSVVIQITATEVANQLHDATRTLSAQDEVINRDRVIAKASMSAATLTVQAQNNYQITLAAQGNATETAIKEIVATATANTVQSNDTATAQAVQLNNANQGQHSAEATLTAQATQYAMEQGERNLTAAYIGGVIMTATKNADIEGYMQGTISAAQNALATVTSAVVATQTAVNNITATAEATCYITPKDGILNVTIRIYPFVTPLESPIYNVINIPNPYLYQDEMVVAVARNVPSRSTNSLWWFIEKPLGNNQYASGWVADSVVTPIHPSQCGDLPISSILGGTRN